MGSHARIAAQLPILYRPDDGDDSLFSSLLAATGGALDGVAEAAGVVLQSHWFRHADKAALEKLFLLRRQERGVVAARPTDVVALRSAAGVTARLDAPSDELGKHLRSQLSARTRGLLAARDPAKPPPFPLQFAVLDDLTRICTGPLLFTTQRFAGVTLSPALAELVALPAAPEELARLNARLLVEAYPRELALPDDDSPYVRDLGRLASSLALPPWREPPDLAESVEDYRLRLSRIVSLYRRGVGTLDAIERMIEAQLPPDRDAAAMEQEREFWLEEGYPFGLTALASAATALVGFNRLRGAAVSARVKARGEPTDLLGPLMSFSLQNMGLAPAAPTFYVTGVQPVTDQTQATVSPMLELYADSQGRERTGLGYRDTLAPGVTLRLRPAYTSWLATQTGVSTSRSSPTDETTADPAAPGPWTPVEDGPTGVVTALARTRDNALWAGATDGADHSLWRFDGSRWRSAATLPGAVNVLLAAPEALLIGTDAGLLSVPLFPPDGEFAPAPVPGVGDRAVLALLRTAPPARLWIGADDGAFVLDGTTLTPTPLAGVEVNDIFLDQGGALLFATSLGVFLHRPAFAQWFFLRTGGLADQDRDWTLFAPTTDGGAPALPTNADVFIPPTRCVLRQADGTIWIGSEKGIARYVARATSESGPPAYQTVLEAFPDLVPGVVHAIRQDEHGLLWFCTDRGLLRFDGRQFAQFRAPLEDAPEGATGEWVRLGKAGLIPRPLPEARGNWRFDRAGAQWQRATEDNPRFTPFVQAQPRTTQEPAVLGVEWADSVAPDLGTWDGTTFARAEGQAVEAAKLVSRVKPTETRVVPGGIPALPRVPVGVSLWRYLALEPGVPDAVDPSPLPESTPETWTTEGRLIPRPPGRAMVVEGRFDLASSPRGVYDNSVFNYPPAAGVWIEWHARRPFTVLARLLRRFDSETIPPAVLDRVWQGMNQVRPAGVKLLLAVEDTIVRG